MQLGVRWPRAGLVVAHPIHELRLFGWMSRARPRLWVLTDGSGHEGTPRIERSRDLARRLNLSTGSIFGRMSDLEAYRKILDREAGDFVALAGELAEEFLQHDIALVVGDAIEGFNPVHDVCRLMTNAAVRIAAGAGRAIENFDALVVGPPDRTDDAHGREVIRLILDDEELAQKLDASARYSDAIATAIARSTDAPDRQFSEPDSRRVILSPETRSALDAMLGTPSVESFRIECLRRVVDEVGYPLPHVPPYYERYGQDLIRAGRYERAITCEDHVRPIADALRNIDSRSG